MINAMMFRLSKRYQRSIKTMLNSFFLQESSVFFGALLQHPLYTKHTTDLISRESVSTLGELFFKTLTRCRHRGAIEGCNLGFTAFCTKLLDCSEVVLHDIPKKLLQQVGFYVCCDYNVSITILIS